MVLFGKYITKTFQVGFVALCGLATASCGYTAEREWARLHLIGTPEPPVTNLPSALRTCVEMHDPDRLHDLNKGRKYLTSGWFVGNSRREPVLRCMKQNGWMAVPTQIYTS